MNTTSRIFVQVLEDSAVKPKAEAVAVGSVFSSFQYAIRRFLSKFAKKEVTVAFEESLRHLSSKAQKRYKND